MTAVHTENKTSEERNDFTLSGSQPAEKKSSIAGYMHVPQLMFTPPSAVHIKPSQDNSIAKQGSNASQER